MASAVAMIGVALVNALAFSCSNYLFSHMGKCGDAEVEKKKKHDKALEQLEEAQAAWSKNRTERLDFINEEIQYRL